MTAPVRRRPAPLRAAVRRTTQITPHLVRVTVGGEALARFRWPGPAGHLKLVLPDPVTGEMSLPEPDADGMVVFGGNIPLTMRTYTARRFDPAARELDLDIVLHGDGPAASWAVNAKAGDCVAVSVPRSAGFVEDPAADWILVAGDASALPAIATIAEMLTTPSTIVVEVDDASDRVPLDLPVTWLSQHGQPGDALVRAVLESSRPLGRGQVWVAAEAGLIRRIRGGLLSEFDRDQVTTRGYWRTGESDHPDHDYGD